MQRQTKLSNNQIELHKCHLRLGTENLIYLIIKVSKKFPNEPWGFGIFWGCIGDIFGIFWRYFGEILGIFW